MERDETIKYYDKRAAEYDKIYFRNNVVRQGEIAQLYTLSARTLARKTVLDMACGTGFWTKVVSGQAASITGIDINDATLTQALKKKYRCPARFIRSDFFDLPFPPESFGGLLASFVLSHVRRQEMGRLLNNIKKVVRSGSPAFFCDNNLICEMIPEMIWDEDHVNSYRKRWLESGEEFLILKNYFTRDELQDLFNQWGRVENIHFGEYYWAVVVTIR